MPENLSMIPRLLNKYKDLVSVFAIAFLLAGVVLTMQLSKQQQSLSSEASESGTSLVLQASKTSIERNEIIIVEAYLDTKGLKVSAAELHFSYPSDKIEVLNLQEGEFLPVILKGYTPEVGGNASIIVGSTPSRPRTGAGVIARLQIKVIAPLGSNAEISISPKTQIAALGQETNVLAIQKGITISVAKQIVNDGNGNTNSPVAVTITEPSNGSVISQHGFVPVVVNASSSNRIKNIQIYFDNVLVYTCRETTTCTYNIRARKAKSGNHSITAKATDTASLTASSTITVVKP